MLHQRGLQVALGMRRRKVKELNEMRIFKIEAASGRQFCQRC